MEFGPYIVYFHTGSDPSTDAFGSFGKDRVQMIKYSYLLEI